MGLGLEGDIRNWNTSSQSTMKTSCSCDFGWKYDTTLSAPTVYKWDEHIPAHNLFHIGYAPEHWKDFKGSLKTYLGLQNVKWKKKCTVQG